MTRGTEETDTMDTQSTPSARRGIVAAGVGLVASSSLVLAAIPFAPSAGAAEWQSQPVTSADTGVGRRIHEPCWHHLHRIGQWRGHESLSTEQRGLVCTGHDLYQSPGGPIDRCRHPGNGRLDHGDDHRGRRKQFPAEGDPVLLQHLILEFSHDRRKPQRGISSPAKRLADPFRLQLLHLREVLRTQRSRQHPRDVYSARFHRSVGTANNWDEIDRLTEADRVAQGRVVASGPQYLAYGWLDGSLVKVAFFDINSNDWDPDNIRTLNSAAFRRFVRLYRRIAQSQRQRQDRRHRLRQVIIDRGLGLVSVLADDEVSSTQQLPNTNTRRVSAITATWSASADRGAVIYANAENSVYAAVTNTVDSRFTQTQIGQGSSTVQAPSHRIDQCELDIPRVHRLATRDIDLWCTGSSAVRVIVAGVSREPGAPGVIP